MKKLDWYILKKFLRVFFFSIFLFAVIAVVIDVSEKTDDFVRSGLSGPEIFTHYYIGFIPHILALLFPLFVFIAVIFFTSKMAGQTEIVAILASGTTYNRWLRPYWIGGVLLGLLLWVSNQWIVPKANNIRGSFIVNERQFKKYLNKFDFIIRAHQDSYFNAWLLGNEKSFQIGKQIYNSDTNIISNVLTPQYKDGPILRININDTDWLTKNNYLKVLTISTNTGYGRNLYNDSFIVISTNNNTINNVQESNLQSNELNWIIEKNWKLN